MVNRRKLLVQITTTVFIGILCYLGFGSVWVEASIVTNEDLSDNKMDLSLLIWTVFIVGGSIIGTLSYVSWKKYNAELKEKQEAKKDKSVD